MEREMATEAKQIKLSRVGKLPVTLPNGVEAKISDQTVTVKGPKGELSRTLSDVVSVALDNNALVVTIGDDDRRTRAMHGLSRALLNNMVLGVSKGFERTLQIIGIGYRVEKKGKGGRFLLFTLGYSHPILFELPDGIEAEVNKDGSLKLTGIDKEQLGLAAAKIRSFRKPEPYKGKGIKYADEVLIRKAGKSAAR